MPYDPLPAPRLEYDRDGTRVYDKAGSSPSYGLSPTDGVTALADDSKTTTFNVNNLHFNNPYSVLLYFPERRDISHIYLVAATVTPNVVVEVSEDTTTGTDGSWSVLPVNKFIRDDTSNYRDDIAEVSALGVIAMRFTVTNGDVFNTYLNTLHIYGEASAEQDLHRLRLWHPTIDAPLDDYPGHLDWGNVAQNSVATKTFRVKNDSASLTASGVTLKMESLTDSTPNQISQHTISKDGETFVGASTPGVSLGDLPAQTISPIVHLRRNTLVSAQLGLWRQRLVAGASTWT